MPRFTLFRRGRAERSVEVAGDDILIGRIPGTDIELESPTVSRRHARVRRDGDGFVLEDLGSTNGSVVRGARVRWQRLAAGDLVHVGDYAIAFDPPEAVFAEGLAATPSPALPPQQKFGMTVLSARNLREGSWTPPPPSVRYPVDTGRARE